MKLADGFGNYLYIIFAVVYVIYSIIKAGKKVTQNRPTIDKQHPQSSPTTVQPPTASPVPEHNQGDELKRMLEDLLGGGGEEEIPERQEVKPQPLVIQEKPKPVKISSQIPRKEKRAPVQAKVKEAASHTAFVAHPEIVQKTFMEQPPEPTVEIDFDIRQAVIYSEILKRPSY